MDWAELIEVVGPPAIAFVGGLLVGRIGMKTEVIRLRYAIADRRIKEFDAAATDLLSMLLNIAYPTRPALGEFCERQLAATYRLLATADLALMPEYCGALDLCGTFDPRQLRASA